MTREFALKSIEDDIIADKNDMFFEHMDIINIVTFNCIAVKFHKLKN